MNNKAAHQVPICIVTRISVLLSFVVFMLGMASSSIAEEEKEHAEWTISAECRMILVPQKYAFGLIEELSDAGKIDATWQRVLQMIEKDEIESLGSLVLKGDEGRTLICETVEEVRYPTEFDPPQLPDKMPQENAVEALKAWPVTGATPTAFETRNVGQTLELKAEVSKDGNWLDVDVVPQHVRFLRWVKFDSGRLSNGERLTIEQPYFHTMKNNVGLQLRNGQRVLLGVHKAPEPNEKSYELFVFKITATKNGDSK